MEKPSRKRNLFDDDSDELDEYVPGADTFQVFNQREEAVEEKKLMVDEGLEEEDQYVPK